jgi:septal ring factor EnvC (AmiA/AmiB activator)
VKLLLSSRNPYELISRYHTLKTLARHGSARITLARANVAALEAGRAENLRQAAVYKASKKGAEQAKRNAATEKKRRENLMGTVRLKKTRIQGLIKELDAADLRLQNLFSRLAEVNAEQRRNHRRVRTELDHGPSKLGRRHSLPWPVRGRVLSRFGQQQHPIFNTTIFNRGIEIAAPLGAAVRAVAAGTVFYADELESYGQLVILDHGGGYSTVYGHNSALSVKEGESVVQGQAIAEVGDSSTLQRAALYFEVRALAKAMDPFLWLAR